MTNGVKSLPIIIVLTKSLDYLEEIKHILNPNNEIQHRG